MQSYIVHVCSNVECEKSIVQHYSLMSNTPHEAKCLAEARFYKQTGKEVTLSWTREIEQGDL